MNFITRATAIQIFDPKGSYSTCELLCRGDEDEDAEKSLTKEEAVRRLVDNIGIYKNVKCYVLAYEIVRRDDSDICGDFIFSESKVIVSDDPADLVRKFKTDLDEEYIMEL